jgi:hypothetical protein
MNAKSVLKELEALGNESYKNCFLRTMEFASRASG